jgi:hypothetical protein
LICARAINAEDKMHKSRISFFITVYESTNLDVIGGKKLLEFLK